MGPQVDLDHQGALLESALMNDIARASSLVEFVRDSIVQAVPLRERDICYLKLLCSPTQ